MQTRKCHAGANADANGICTKSICPALHRLGDIIKLTRHPAIGNRPAKRVVVESPLDVHLLLFEWIAIVMKSNVDVSDVKFYLSGIWTYCTAFLLTEQYCEFIKIKVLLLNSCTCAKYSRLSLSQTRLSRITAYLEVKMWSVLTQRSTNRQQNIVEKSRNCSFNFSSFPQYFQYISNLGVKLKIHSVKGGCLINCFPHFRQSDMSKYGYLGVS